MRGTRISNDLDEAVRKIGLMMPESMIQEVDAAAGSVGLDRSSFVRNVVRRYIDGSLVDLGVVATLASCAGGMVTHEPAVNSGDGPVGGGTR